jgi:hypothetical protein
MSEGDQDHSGVPVTIAVVARGLDQTLDLLLGQVLPCPQLLIFQTPRFTLVGAASLRRDLGIESLLI